MAFADCHHRLNGRSWLNSGMAAMGRILQIVGWLWFAAGIVGGMVGYDSISVFPGLVLIFIARIFRARARSEMPPAPGEGQAEQHQERTEPRQPERRQPAPASPPPAPTYTTPDPEPEPEMEPKRPVQERNELLERIALAGRDVAEEPPPAKSENVEPKSDEGAKTPMSSAEMIAQARRRWDRS